MLRPYKIPHGGRIQHDGGYNNGVMRGVERQFR
jgi:hypothetical protein